MPASVSPEFLASLAPGSAVADAYRDLGESGQEERDAYERADHIARLADRVRSGEIPADRAILLAVHESDALQALLAKCRRKVAQALAAALRPEAMMSGNGPDWARPDAGIPARVPAPAPAKDAQGLAERPDRPQAPAPAAAGAKPPSGSWASAKRDFLTGEKARENREELFVLAEASGAKDPVFSQLRAMGYPRPSARDAADRLAAPYAEWRRARTAAREFRETADRENAAKEAAKSKTRAESAVRAAISGGRLAHVLRAAATPEELGATTLRALERLCAAISPSRLTTTKNNKGSEGDGSFAHAANAFLENLRAKAQAAAREGGLSRAADAAFETDPLAETGLDGAAIDGARVEFKALWRHPAMSGKGCMLEIPGRIAKAVRDNPKGKRCAHLLEALDSLRDDFLHEAERLVRQGSAG